MITTGLLGGFTTFSTAMVEALTARLEGKMVKFLMLWLVQVVGAMVAALAGALLFVMLFGRYIAPVFPPDVLYRRLRLWWFSCHVWVRVQLFSQFRLG